MVKKESKTIAIHHQTKISSLTYSLCDTFKKINEKEI